MEWSFTSAFAIPNYSWEGFPPKSYLVCSRQTVDIDDNLLARYYILHPVTNPMSSTGMCPISKILFLDVVSQQYTVETIETYALL
jgi:hypothetical protein